MFNIGPAELVVILLVALVILGPDKLPDMARTVGKGLRELRKATEDLKDQVETEFYAAEPPPQVKPPAALSAPRPNVVLGDAAPLAGSEPHKPE